MYHGHVFEAWPKKTITVAIKKGDCPFQPVQILSSFERFDCFSL